MYKLQAYLTSQLCKHHRIMQKLLLDQFYHLQSNVNFPVPQLLTLSTMYQIYTKSFTLSENIYNGLPAIM